MAKKRVVHIEDFFTQTNAENGMWFEPEIEIEGEMVGCGFEFLVTGVTTTEAMADDEHFAKLYTEAESIKDPIEKFNKKQSVDAKRCARLVKGIRAVEGCEVDFGGKSLEFSIPLIEQIFLKSPMIKTAVVNFASKTTNFIKREKNA